MLHRAVTFVAALALAAAPPTFAYQRYQDDVPNGDKVMHANEPWGGVGHLRSGGGGERNQFGKDFAAAGHEWTKELCEKDSDGDGLTNGKELGDPGCTWTKGTTPQFDKGITHPGVCNAESANAVHDSCANFSLPSGVTSVSLQFRMKNHAVPAEDTTYEKQTFVMADLMTNAGLDPNQDVWAFKFEPHIDQTNPNTHHMVLYGCSGNKSDSGTAAARAQKYIDNPHDAGDGMPCDVIMYAWAVGGGAFCPPANVAFKMSSEIEYYMLEVHYDNPQELTTYTDQSGVDITVVPVNDPLIVTQPEAAGFIFLGVNPGDMSIPAEKSAYVITQEYTVAGSNIDEDIATVFAVAPHGHQYMTQAWTEVHRNNNYTHDVMCDSQYDFDLQEFKTLKEPKGIRQGDKLITRCVYDTSASNVTVLGGDSSQQEMCISVLLYYPKFPDHVKTSFLTTPTSFGDWADGTHSCGDASSCSPAESVGATAAETYLISHGALMVAAWCLLLPCGIAAAIFREAWRGEGSWFRMHWVLQVLGLILAVAGLAVVVALLPSGSTHFGGTNAAHKIIGLVVMVIAVMQPANALVRPHLPGEGKAKSTKRKVWEAFHKNAGRLAVPLAIANCVLGGLAVQNSGASPIFAWALIGGCCVSSLCCIVLLWSRAREAAKAKVFA